MTHLFKVNDEIKLINGTHYFNSDKAVPENALNVRLYVRKLTDNGYIVARAQTGPILGEVSEKAMKYAIENDAVIKPYAIKTIDATPLYQSATKNSGVIDRINEGELITIVNQKNGFGKIKMGAGWIELAKVKVLK